jgi:Fe2+ or Zn2+ uptake regulation protein
VYAGDAMKNKKHKRVLDEYISFLDINGIRMNEQLNGLITFFFSTDNHLSFEDIKLYILENKLEISDMQIRDTLALLVEYGFAIEKDFGDHQAAKNVSDYTSKAPYRFGDKHQIW